MPPATPRSADGPPDTRRYASCTIGLGSDMTFISPLLLCAVLSAPGNPPASWNPSLPAAAALLAVVPQGQGGDPPNAKPVTPAHTGFHALLKGVKDDVEHLPARQNLYIAAIGGGLALGVHPFDQTIDASLQHHYPIANALFAPAKYYGDTPEQVALSIGAWALGRALHKPKLSHLGLDLLRAQALTEIMVEPLKFATRRERPDGSNAQSFPSGHAAITFAAATVIQRHLGWRHSVWAYGIASYVAASRLHDNRHFASDVVFGAAVGTIAGRTVTTHGRDTWTFGPMPIQRGIAIGATRTAF